MDVPTRTFFFKSWCFVQQIFHSFLHTCLTSQRLFTSFPLVEDIIVTALRSVVMVQGLALHSIKPQDLSRRSAKRHGSARIFKSEAKFDWAATNGLQQHSQDSNEQPNQAAATQTSAPYCQELSIVLITVLNNSQNTRWLLEKQSAATTNSTNHATTALTTLQQH